jgi:hypothetical protein
LERVSEELPSIPFQSFFVVRVMVMEIEDVLQGKSKSLVRDRAIFDVAPIQDLGNRSSGAASLAAV